MKPKQEKKPLLIDLAGRIDSNNVNLVEEQVEKTVDETHPENIVLNARDLDYISSAGLRLLLKLQKRYPTMKVIEVNREVAEIFEMTGFDQILHIEKALREISIEGKELIGQGGYGFVYRLDPETIVKVYKVSNQKAIEKQMERAREAFFHGVPTAIPYDTVKVEDRLGSVFELIRSDTLAATLNQNPELLDTYVLKLFEVLKTMSKTDVSDFIDEQCNDHFKEVLSDIQDLLSESEWNELCEIIDAIPERPTMIHGDMHCKNIMVQDGELLLIDMDEMMTGHPIYDLADIYLAYNVISKREHPEKYIGMSRELSENLLSRLLNLYLEGLNQSERDKVLSAIEVVASLRMAQSAILNNRQNVGKPIWNERSKGYARIIENQVLPFKEQLVQGLACYPEF